MVSLQASLLPDEEIKKTMTTSLDLPSFLAKKRKRRDGGENEDFLAAKEPRLPKAEEKDKAEEEEEEEDRVALNLDAPLPLDWQRCLDIKSGQIHFYNTRTHRRTSTDPTRLSLEPPAVDASCRRPSLDLELNLACEPPPANNPKDEFANTSGSLPWMSSNNNNNNNNNNTVAAAAAAVDGEMVAAVCMRCHMLVMMSKDALSCPNCKFVHPADRGASPMMKLLCCKD